MKNIVLIGMSGVGKTQKGKYIARNMDWNFMDTDSLIVQQEGITIDHIFTKYGEDYFRNVESDLIKNISKLGNNVIAAGGGVILRKENMDNFRKNGFIVYLKGDILTIVDNLNRSRTVRPLLKGNDNLYKKVSDLYQSRESLYSSYSHITIDIEAKTPNDIYNEVIKAYNEYITCDK